MEPVTARVGVVDAYRSRVGRQQFVVGQRPGGVVVEAFAIEVDPLQDGWDAGHLLQPGHDAVNCVVGIHLQRVPHILLLPSGSGYHVPQHDQRLHHDRVGPSLDRLLLDLTSSNSIACRALHRDLDEIGGCQDFYRGFFGWIYIGGEGTIMDRAVFFFDI